MKPRAASSAQRPSFLSVGTPVGAEQLGKAKLSRKAGLFHRLESPGEPLLKSECCVHSHAWKKGFTQQSRGEKYHLKASNVLSHQSEGNTNSCTGSFL